MTARNRKLRVYWRTVTASPDLSAAVDGSPRQVRGVVAAYNQRQAAALLGISPGEFRHSGGALPASSPFHASALAEPGQVFVMTEHGSVRRPGTSGTRVPVRAAVTLGSPRRLAPGAVSDLALADALIAQETDRKAAERARIDGYVQEREDRAARRAETSRVVEETLDRARQALEDLGISPQTVREGTAGFNRIGVLMPAETFERLLELAAVGHQFGDDQ